MQQNIVKRVAVRRATLNTKIVQDINICDKIEKIPARFCKARSIETSIFNLNRLRLTPGYMLLLIECPHFITLILYLVFVFVWAKICILWSPFTHNKEKRYVAIMRVIWPFAKIDIPNADLSVVPIHAMNVIDKYVDWEPVGNIWEMEMKDGFAIAGVICLAITHLLC